MSFFAQATRDVFLSTVARISSSYNCLLHPKLWTKMREIYSLFTFLYSSEFTIQGSVKVRLHLLFATRVRPLQKNLVLFQRVRKLPRKLAFGVFVPSKLPTLRLLPPVLPVPFEANNNKNNNNHKRNDNDNDNISNKMRVISFLYRSFSDIANLIADKQTLTDCTL